MKTESILNVVKGIDKDFDESDIPAGGFVDTGSYALNALISATMYGGISDNRATMFAGEFSTGKTYLTMGIARSWMEKTGDGELYWLDTEFALDKHMVAKRDIDPARFFIQYPETIQDCQTKLLNVLKGYKDLKGRRPLMIVLDSLGNMPSIKELEDAAAGKNVRDMTKQQVIRSLFRTVMFLLGYNQVPMIITNHVYDPMEAKAKVVSGGGGAKFNCSTIITLTKAQHKDKEDVVGSVITAKTFKSRLSKEIQSVETLLDFGRGLHRYYGLLPIAEKHGILKKLSTQYEFPDGSKHYEKHIYANAERYFTKEIMERLEEAVKKEFSLGGESA